MAHKDPEQRKKYHREWASKRYHERADIREKIKARRRKHPLTCDHCGKTFLGRKTDARFCTRACSAKWMWENGKANSFRKGHKPKVPFPKGYKPANSKGGRTKSVQGYVLIHKPSHPNAGKAGYVFEHRLVMSQILGRPLYPWEKVHHRNGIKDDNRPENLQIMTLKVHCGEVECPCCGAKFLIR